MKKRSLVVAGRRTSISVEDEFWGGLKVIAKVRGETLSELVSRIDADRKSNNLSSIVRVFVLAFYKDQLSAGTADLERVPEALSPVQ